MQQQSLPKISDQLLLDRFVTARDPAAFEELTRRYAPIVYGAAMRQVNGDAHLAEDVTQAVFIIFARQAARVRSAAVLPAWLFGVTRHAVSNARRMQARRRYHEMRKAAMTQTHYAPATSRDDDDETARASGELVDEAIRRLSAGERSAVLLRYFAGRTHRQIAEAMAISEEASRKRIGRALDKMRQFLHARGVTASDVALSGALLHVAAIAQPAHLVESVVNVALMTNAMTQTTAATQIAAGAMRMITIGTKLKAVAAVALCASAALVGVAVAQSGGGKAQVAAADANAKVAAPMHAPAAGTSRPSRDREVPLVVGENGEMVVEISKDVKIRLAGVAPYEADADSWFSIAGAPIKAPEDLPAGEVHAQPPPDHQILMRLDAVPSMHPKVRVLDSNVMANLAANDHNGPRLLTAFRVGRAKQAALEISFPSDQTTLATNDKPQEGGTFDAGENGQFTFAPVEEEEGKAKVTVAHEGGDPDDHPSITAIDTKGGKHRANRINVQNDGQATQLACEFEIPAKEIKSFVAQKTNYGSVVLIEGISMEKGHVTQPKVTVSGS